MATLIAPLVSGIVGGGSGTAEFYRRGTTTPVIVYADADASAAVGKTVTLDANGGYELYADESVFVRVRSSLGVVVREFTVVHADAAVDVESTSFTGTLPSGSQGAGGRVDLQTVLDRWRTSAGTLDFEILRTGHTTAESLTEAFDNVSSSNAPLFNVRTYGAVGDGTTDDYAAFVLCRDAAVAFGGGIIFVPGGNYLLSSAFAITSQKVSMLGVGAQASIITSGLSAGVAITINAGASTFSGISIRDLQITNAIGGANVTPLQIVSTPGVLLQDVMIKQHALAVDIRSRVFLHHCDFTVPSSATAGDYVLALTSNAADSVILGGTFTNSKVANTGGIHVSVANVLIQGAKVDISALTGAGYGIEIDTASGTRVLGCDLITGVAATYGIRVNADVSLVESHNIWSGSGGVIFLATALLKGTQVRRGSREERYKVLTTIAAMPATLTVDTDYEINEVTCTASGALTIGTATPANVVHNGMRLLLRIINTSGGNVTFTYTSGVNLKFTIDAASTLTAAATLATAVTRNVELMYTGTPATGQWFVVAVS